MSDDRHCPKCGAPLPSDAMEGVCPKCMAQVVFGEERDDLGKPSDLPDNTVKTPDSDISIERTGMMIGRYKLLEQIGEGGFGMVYMAEQVEPVHRKVALKVVKAGMDTRAVVARFEAERQAAALMDHANIAKVLDGGVTQAGRPYFVMELVRGIPITEFCDQKNLDTAERLKLFIQVCKAVQHAHQKGIIHRDLKPSNILVTLHDAEPVPKIIDFGVAKALGQQLTEKTLFTGFMHMVGTPAYMSPEQAELSGLDIDTRSDIYSLGVLLYELLTGVTPFDAETLRDAAIDEVRRMIRETEPPRPSTRLRTLGDKLTDIAKCRHIEPPKLIHVVRGDLDWIVMQCLDKDRRRRYETANGLAMDVQRHLDEEPVVACPPSAGYRLHKLIRRNKLVCAAVGAVIATLVVGLAISIAALARERVARERAVAAEQEQIRLREQADRERRRAQEVAEQLGHRLWGLGDDLTAAGGDEPAVQVIREALHVFEKASQDFPDNPFFRQERARSLHILGHKLSLAGQVDEAEPHYHESIALYAALKSEAPTNAFYHQEEAYTVWGVANMLSAAGREDAAAPYYAHAAALYQEACARFPAALKIRAHLAAVLRRQGKLAEAEGLLRETIESIRETSARDNKSLAEVFFWLGLVLDDRGSAEEATVAFVKAANYGNKHAHNSAAWLLATHPDPKARDGERALELAAKAVEMTGRANANYLDTLAAAYAGTGQFLEAVRVQREAIDLLPPERQDRIKDFESRLRLFESKLPYYDASTIAHRARILLESGEFTEAESLASECLEIRQRQSPDSWLTFNAQSLLGGSLLGQGNYLEAEPLLLAGYEAMMQRKDRIPGRGRIRLNEAAQRLVKLYEVWGKPDRAAEWKRKLAELE